MNLTKHVGILTVVLLALLGGAVVAQEPVRTEVFPMPGRMGALAIEPDGPVLAGGLLFLSRLYPDGTREDLPSRGIIDTFKFGVQADGGILIRDNSRLWRLDPDGLDPTRIDSSRDFALQPDGNLLISAGWDLVRRTPDGALDPSFASTITTSLEAIVELQEDGKILVNGGIPPMLQRLDPDGTADTAFQPEVSASSVSRLLLQPDGKILISGSGPGFLNASVRLNPDGTIDLSFSDLYLGGMVQALQADGKILLKRDFRVSSPMADWVPHSPD